MQDIPELENCRLCEWQCGVNRLEGELGVCRIGRPKVASAVLHPAPPQSYTIFLSGCNFRCLGCQNWSIAHFPDTNETPRGYVEPKCLGEEAYDAVNSREGNFLGADRIFFSGGSPTPSLPYVEQVVREARKIGDIKVNYDTNGFLTVDSLKRVIEFTDSITFDIKAYHDDVHRALTGAPVEPVLRNARYLAENAREKLWEFRILLIPKISVGEIKPLVDYISGIDPTLPLNFLAFRPNFVLENYKGASKEFMEKAVRMAKEGGLENVDWSGRVGLPGRLSEKTSDKYENKGGEIAGGIAKEAGCVTHPRNCVACELEHECPIKNYRPAKKSI
ncbi:hypothetical protein AKJ64_04195 [candidate division MSBL1 archaeon SCGC-AAA259E17]|uniref:Radical SAM core domain-containing protein n=1 Tax=candidate division MSBL1 archaeon SCGC-AAA259E17 TaxID=1698263 RepID=A0A133UCZ0_9EURY|nr:hypothetical protein AKJ64_04195 [candidate division MSBL1 archaeon SCGC-AAA259E17]